MSDDETMSEVDEFQQHHHAACPSGPAVASAASAGDSGRCGRSEPPRGSYVRPTQSVAWRAAMSFQSIQPPSAACCLSSASASTSQAASSLSCFRSRSSDAPVPTCERLLPSVHEPERSSDPLTPPFTAASSGGSCTSSSHGDSPRRSLDFEQSPRGAGSAGTRGAAAAHP
eukprot:CAMPEP_0174712498 /NCGR_PEP_ID=MMETSP1094-20130205/13474_1 /TAXON_ID=156173 /ORGANISM="Chrysochromulina brevifilum, Strain UTEX LB 985" /LENGTH=170 /DNA_ID=CAMNT_0015911573 /DNA_START=147 /DNA_END=656 /DNA_ORIENTATION=-